MGIIDGLVARAEGLPRTPDHRLLIGIAGAPGSGKTTLATALVAALGGFPRAAHVPMDGFHLADVELARLGRADRKGAPDTFDAGGYAALLRRIADGEAVWAPSFERTLEQPIAQSIPVLTQTQVVVSEGNYLLAPEPQWRAARTAFAEVWFCREDEGVRVRRLIARHIEFGKTPAQARAWVQRLDERNAELVRSTVADADLVIDLDGADLRALSGTE
jgi:pantothenate kinase